jgi:hypothetical protein
MRKFMPSFLLCLWFVLFISCKDEDENVRVNPTIGEISLSDQMGEFETMEIEVTIQKPTPCHFVDRVDLQVSERTYDYDIILDREEGVCAQVIEDETVSIFFDPQERGEYTLNFLINGRFIESRQVQVE